MVEIKDRINVGYYTESIRLPKDVVYYNPKQAPFKIYGLYKPESEDVYKRLPDAVGKMVNPNVARLYTNPAGGRIRFSTDSEYLVIKTSFPYLSHRSMISLNCSAGFDVYVEHDGYEVYAGTVKPSVDTVDRYENYILLGDKQKRNLTLYMPIYNDVSTLQIGLQAGCSVEASTQRYADILPVLYYGSSITQGATASRSGMTYESMITRKYNFDYINLGFASGAKGEDAIVEHMATLDISCFVCDYDHNAPTPEHLQNTHKKLYQTMRNAKPDVPIILVSRPTWLHNDPELIARRNIVADTYRYGIANGDCNLYFVDGFSLYGEDFAHDCTADAVHPNDIGFAKMAERIGYEIFCALRTDLAATKIENDWLYQ